MRLSRSGLLLCACMLACGCRRASTQHERTDEAAPLRDYAAALADIDRRLAEARRLARTRDRWPDHELVAQLLVSRARLTGCIDDWLAADRALEAAFAVAPAGGGPLLTRVELDLSLHQLERAEATLAKVEAAPLRTRADDIRVAVARGELAAQRGQLDEAAAAYRRALELGADSGESESRLALVDRRAQRPDEALAKLDVALSRTRDERGRAWLQLQAGLVEWGRERPEAALRHYDAAERSLPGWWLVAEHRAEALAALGRSDEAEAIYRDVIESTGHPEFMDALGELLLARGRTDEAQTWFDAAAREHERRLALLPRAAAAHALDHWLRHAPADARTLALAREIAEAARNEDNLRRLADAQAAQAADRPATGSTLLSSEPP